MKTATLCFLIRDNQICLAMKKRGFGEGKYNGFGGKVGDKEEFEGESVEESLKREAWEEFGIEITNFEKMGEISFLFPDKPDWDQKVFVFICSKWNGIAKESEEMKPFWFNLDQIPYEKMWDDDKYWLPRVLNGEKIRAEFAFDEHGKVLKHKFN